MTTERRNKMTREQWDKAAAEIAPHMDAIQRIAARNGIQLSMAAGYDDTSCNAFWIDSDKAIYDFFGYTDGETGAAYEYRTALTPGS